MENVTEPTNINQNIAQTDDDDVFMVSFIQSFNNSINCEIQNATQYRLLCNCVPRNTFSL